MRQAFTAIQHNGPIRVTWYVLQAMLLLACIYIASAQRPPIISDEGYYLYQAWISWMGKPDSHALFTNFGYLLGIPYLVTKTPDILIFRLYSAGVWLVGFGLFFYSSLRLAGQSMLLLPPLLSFVLITILFNCISYNTLPFILTAGTSSLFLLLAGQPHAKSRYQFLGGLLFSLLIGLSILSHTAMLAVGFIIVVTALLLIKNRFFLIGTLLGCVIGFLLLNEFTPVSIASLTQFFLGQEGSQTFSTEIYGERQDIIKRAILRMLFFTIFALTPLIIGVGLLLLAGWFVFRPQLAAWPLIQNLQQSPRLRNRIILALSSLVVLVTLADQGILSGLVLKSLHFNLRYFDAFLPPIRLYPLLAICLIPLVILFASNLPRQNRIYQSVPLIWFALVTLMEISLGRSETAFYFFNVTPVIFGLVWIWGAQYLQANGTKRLYQIYHGLFSLFALVTLSFYVLNNPDRTPIPPKDSIDMPLLQEKFNGLHLHQMTLDYYNRMEDFYLKNQCESRFFASLGATSMTYFLFDRVSPLNTAWVEESDYQTYVPILTKQQSLCLFYRAPGTEEQALSWGLGLAGLQAPPKSYQFERSEEIYMLALTKD